MYAVQFVVICLAFGHANIGQKGHVWNLADPAPKIGHLNCDKNNEIRLVTKSFEENVNN